MHTNTGRQTRQKLREPLQRAQRLYFFISVGESLSSLWVVLEFGFGAPVIAMA
jgi:hypothetical protein